MQRPAPRSVLVTGAAGFVGAALVRRLRTERDTVRGIDLPSLVCDGVGDWLAHDLTCPLPADALTRVDLVIHAAALAGVQPSWLRPLEYWRANALATILLRESCERAGSPRVVHVSSISVYGEGEHHTERSPTRPMSPYGDSKLAAERAWDGYPQVTIVRLSNVYGPGQRPDMAYATFIRAALRGGSIELRAGGRQRRTPTFIEDCVDGVLAAAVHGAFAATYNIAGPADVRLDTVPAMLGGLTGRTVPVISVPATAGDPLCSTVSTARAARELGFAPRVGLRDGLALQLEEALAVQPPLSATA